MTTIIEQLLEEMWEECQDCGGIRICYPPRVWAATEKSGACETCKGKGRVLSENALELRHLILKEK